MNFPMTITGAALALIALVFPALAQEGGSLVVIAASAELEDFTPGIKVSPERTIHLDDGASLTLVGKDGSIIRLKGPYEGAVSASAESAHNHNGNGDFSGLIALLTDDGGTSSALGGARSGKADAGISLKPPPFALFTESSGPRCVKPGEAALWRDDADAQVRVTIRNAQARSDDLLWSEGEHQLAIPDDFPLEDGRLLVSLDNILREFDLHLLPGSLVSAPPGKVLAWMAEEGCRRQAIVLIDRLHRGIDGQ